MKRIWALWWIGFSPLLAACQTVPDLEGDALCSLRAIEVSQETRAYLRAPILSDDTLPGGQTLPDGYEHFLRDLAAHNAKIRTHCSR